MSAALPDQPQLPSSGMSTLSPVTSIRTSNPRLYSPISGAVGHTFIRLCLWFDLLSSWKKQNYAPPVDGFLNFAASELETEVVPHAAAS
jgi:hypothetical protein